MNCGFSHKVKSWQQIYRVKRRASDIRSKATQFTCLERVKPRPIRRMHLRGVGPRTHVWENHNPLDGQTIQNLSVFLIDRMRGCFKETRKTIRDDDRIVGSAPDPALRSQHQKMGMHKAPAVGTATVIRKSENNTSLRSSLRVSTRVQAINLRRLLPIWMASGALRIHAVPTPAASSSADGADGSVCARIIASPLLRLHQ